VFEEAEPDRESVHDAVAAWFETFGQDVADPRFRLDSVIMPMARTHPDVVFARVAGRFRPLEGWMVAVPPHLIGVEQEQREADRCAAELSERLRRTSELRDEARQLDPATPPQYADPVELQGVEPSPEQPVNLPLESYAPILHNSLTLAAESMGQASEEGYRSFEAAMEKMANSRPKDRTLAELHESAAAYVHAMYRYCEAGAEASYGRIRSSDPMLHNKLRAEESHWEQATNTRLESVQWNIRDLYSNDRPLFDRLGFSIHELVYLELDDLEKGESDGEVSHESLLVSCAECGTELLHDAEYCGECGAPQPGVTN
jgi:hypothetical protein